MDNLANSGMPYVYHVFVDIKVPLFVDVVIKISDFSNICEGTYKGKKK